MIGQEELLKQINKYTPQTLPRNLLLLGETGCGKHTVAKLIAANNYLHYTDLSEQIEQLKSATSNTYAEIINQYWSDWFSPVIPTLLVINLSCSYANKELQTKFLKILEDTPRNVYICIVAESEIDILPALNNRCIKYTFLHYSIDQLRQIKYYDNDIVYKVCKTPGKLVSINAQNIILLFNTVKSLMQNIKSTKNSYSKMLALSALVNYKEEYDKLDFISFFDIIKLMAFEDYTNANNEYSAFIYKYTIYFQQQLFDKVNKTGAKDLNKEHFIINYLTNLWESLYYDSARIKR